MDPHPDKDGFLDAFFDEYAFPYFLYDLYVLSDPLSDAHSYAHVHKHAHANAYSGASDGDLHVDPYSHLHVGASDGDAHSDAQRDGFDDAYGVPQRDSLTDIHKHNDADWDRDAAIDIYLNAFGYAVLHIDRHAHAHVCAAHLYPHANPYPQPDSHVFFDVHIDPLEHGFDDAYGYAPLHDDTHGDGYHDPVVDRDHLTVRHLDRFAHLDGDDDVHADTHVRLHVHGDVQRDGYDYGDFVAYGYAAIHINPEPNGERDGYLDSDEHACLHDDRDAHEHGNIDADSFFDEYSVQYLHFDGFDDAYGVPQCDSLTDIHKHDDTDWDRFAFGYAPVYIDAYQYVRLHVHGDVDGFDDAYGVPQRDAFGDAAFHDDTDWDRYADIDIYLNAYGYAPIHRDPHGDAHPAGGVRPSDRLVALSQPRPPE